MNTTNEYRQELRGKIIAYAMTEFYKRGVKAVKMDEISQGLHVSKRTVYEIFGDKEELLLAGIKAKREESRTLMDAYASTEAKNVIDIISYFYKLEIERNGVVGALFYEEIHKFPRVLEFLKESHEKDREQRMLFFEAGIKEGFFREDINYTLLSELGNMLMEEIMHRQLYKQYSMQELFDNFFMVTIRGFCTERGVELLNKAIQK